MKELIRHALSYSMIGLSTISKLKESEIGIFAKDRKIHGESNV